MSQSRALPDFAVLDPRLFKAFVAAARTLNFTAAARQLHATQSGVSQHVAKLEEGLGLALFERVNRAVRLTDAGRALLAYTEDYADRVERFVQEVHGRERELAGPVAYAMPASCLLSPHLPALLEKRRSHPEIALRVTVAPNPKVYRLVLDGSADFGFVTRRQAEAGLTFIPFCDEEHLLVGAEKTMVLTLSTPEGFAAARFVGFPGMRSYVDGWLKTHLPRHRRALNAKVRTAGTINSIEGAITMLKAGVGAAVLPRHCVAAALDAGQLFVCPGPDRKKTAVNEIAIVTAEGRHPPARVQQVISWFLEMRQ